MAMICLLGFGEVGQTFGEDLRSGFTAWDVQFVDPASVPTKAAARRGMVVPAGHGRPWRRPGSSYAR